MNGMMMFGGPPGSNVEWFALIAGGIFLFLWLLVTAADWISRRRSPVSHTEEAMSAAPADPDIGSEDKPESADHAELAHARV